MRPGPGRPDEGCPPYWLFRQVLRELTKTSLPNEFHRAHLSFIAPEPQARPRRPGSPANDAEQRFAVFESEGVAGSRLVLFVTYRDTETGGQEELTAFLAALARQDTVTRIRLTGLSQDEAGRRTSATQAPWCRPGDAAGLLVLKGFGERA